MEHINSASYITVLCSDEANPKFNRLQLRTDPPTFIELRPGKNILTVEEYPDLKDGFSQIDEILDDKESAKLEGIMSTYGEENCQEVLEFDFSHFDASEMTTMDYMFDWMQNIRKIEFGDMRTPKLTSADHAFSFANNRSIEVLDLSGFDFSSLIDANCMFRGTNIGVLNLSGCDLSNVKFGIDMFESANIRELILDDIQVNEEVLDSILLNSDTLKLSLKGWKKTNISRVIRNLENYRNTFSLPNMEKAAYVLDKNLDFKLYETEGRILKCQLIRMVRNSSKWFKITGSILERYSGQSTLVAIPDGISHIDDKAFENCDKLETVILPESIKSIGSYAFNGCASLRFINIPSSVKEIRRGAFAGCKQLKQLYLPDGIEKCESLEKERLNYFRIPLHIWNEGLCETIRISHLVVGLDRKANGLNPVSIGLGENGRSTIVFEASENSGEGLFNVNGALLTCKDLNEEGNPKLTALSIANSTLSVPTGVVYISDHCFGKKRILPIYIPDTVDHISSNAIHMADGILPILVTKKSNYTHLKNILPLGMDYVTIYLI